MGYPDHLLLSQSDYFIPIFEHVFLTFCIKTQVLYGTRFCLAYKAWNLELQPLILAAFQKIHLVQALVYHQTHYLNLIREFKSNPLFISEPLTHTMDGLTSYSHSGSKNRDWLSVILTLSMIVRQNAACKCWGLDFSGLSHPREGEIT